MPGLPDLIAFLLSESPPDRDKGEYTAMELSRAMGWAQGSASHKAQKLVDDGKATARTAMATNVNGRRFSTTVYKLKSKG